MQLSAPVAYTHYWCFAPLTPTGALRHEPSIWATNGVGIMFSIFNFVQFSRYAPQISKPLPGTKQIHIHASMATMLSIAALAILLPEQTAATIVGDLGVAFVMMLNASPLVAIKTVIDEKSADSIPLSFTLASIACCFFWSIVGLKQLHDWVVYFPNMMGLCFGFFQLGLKLMYSNVDDETFACSQGSLASKEIACAWVLQKS